MFLFSSQPEIYFFYYVILPVKYMYGTWRTWHAHKGHCEHVKCVFLEMYFESWETTQMFKFSMSHLIFRIPQDVRLDNLPKATVGALGLSCGLHHAAGVGSGFHVSFSYIQTHTRWPVWRQACNLPKPTHRPIGFGFNLVSSILAIVLFAPLSWFFLLFPPVYVVLVVFTSLLSHI